MSSRNAPGLQSCSIRTCWQPFSIRERVAVHHLPDCPSTGKARERFWHLPYQLYCLTASGEQQWRTREVCHIPRIPIVEQKLRRTRNIEHQWLASRSGTSRARRPRHLGLEGRHAETDGPARGDGPRVMGGGCYPVPRAHNHRIEPVCALRTPQPTCHDRRSCASGAVRKGRRLSARHRPEDSLA